jgi:hypothetical protein
MLNVNMIECGLYCASLNSDECCQWCASRNFDLEIKLIILLYIGWPSILLCCAGIVNQLPTTRAINHKAQWFYIYFIYNGYFGKRTVIASKVSRN